MKDSHDDEWSGLLYPENYQLLPKVEVLLFSSFDSTKQVNILIFLT